MKKTIAVSLEHEAKVTLLMQKLTFEEIDRVATGGMMSSPCVLITFAGLKENYHNKGYIFIPNEDIEGKSKDKGTYFSFKYPDGIWCNNIFDFIKNQKDENFEYKQL